MKADGFDALSDLELDSQEYDLVIIDPPAFAKRKKQTHVALNAYMKLAQAGAKVTKKGGILSNNICFCNERKT